MKNAGQPSVLIDELKPPPSFIAHQSRIQAQQTIHISVKVAIQLRGEMRRQHHEEACCRRKGA